VDNNNPTGYPQVLDEIVNGAVTRTCAYGLNRISENQLVGSTWTPSFYGYDGHGNVRFLANTAGTMTDAYQFDAFGMQIASTGTTANNFRYSGERFDSALNLYHLRARYYNMLTGRFLTMDPGQQRESCCDGGRTCCASCASQSEDILHPGTLHKYVYAQDDPVNHVDPSGKSLEEEGEIDEITLESERTVKRLGVEEDCVEEWAYAYTMCAEWLSSPNPHQYPTGGYNDIANCARGLVSERCGGNPISW
jgi:RHS repeat-associated protein